MEGDKSLNGDHAGKGGEDALTKPVLEGDLNLQPLKNMLMSIKNEAERWLGLFEMGPRGWKDL